jgi:hypothetical protein
MQMADGEQKRNASHKTGASATMLQVHNESNDVLLDKEDIEPGDY